MPTAAPRADVACRASPDGRPHRPQSKSGHRSRRSGKPAGSVCRSSPLPSCVFSWLHFRQPRRQQPHVAAHSSDHRIGSGLRPRDRRPFVGARHLLRPHFARSSSTGHRWSAARDTSWLTLITRWSPHNAHYVGDRCQADHRAWPSSMWRMSRAKSSCRLVWPWSAAWSCWAARAGRNSMLVWNQLGQPQSSSGQSVRRRAWLASRAIAQPSATGPTCPSLSGLLTERIVWICPSSTSSVKVKSTLPSRSWKIAPG